MTSSQIEEGDHGHRQRATRIVYDPVGAWAGCTPKQLTYWHCLDDENYNVQRTADEE